MPEDNLISIAFYNTENLFDYKHDTHTLDLDYTPAGKKKWGLYRYQHKINKIANVIAKIGTNKCVYPPVLVGLAEVETKEVANDIIHTELLRYLNYDCVHYESPDERGIDVALLYNKDFFTLNHSEAIPTVIYETNGTIDLTRDILYVNGSLCGEFTHVFVTHWPSRRDGIDKTENKRIEVAKILRNKIENIKSENPEAKFIILGDFNDDPDSISITDHLMKSDFINPMNQLTTHKTGSLKHNGTWHLFDQILLSSNYLHEGIHFQKSW